MALVLKGLIWKDEVGSTCNSLAGKTKLCDTGGGGKREGPMLNLTQVRRL